MSGIVIASHPKRYHLEIIWQSYISGCDIVYVRWDIFCCLGARDLNLGFVVSAKIYVIKCIFQKVRPLFLLNCVLSA